jgi:predicted phage tail protein
MLVAPGVIHELRQTKSKTMNLKNWARRALAVVALASTLAAAGNALVVDASTAAVTVGATGVGGAQAEIGVSHASAPSGAPMGLHAVDLAPGLGAAQLTVAVTKPTAPRSPKATPRNTRVRLTWLAPSSDGGAPVNRYLVQRSRTGTSRWRTIGYPKRTSFKATGLTNGIRYYFRIRAHNAAGWGPYSKVVSAVPRTVPMAPRSPTATPGNTTVKLTWLRPSSNGGAAINKYAVQRAVAGGAWKTISSPTTRSYTAGGLVNGTKYYFRIRAHNAAGWGPYSTVVNTVPGTVPTAPQNSALQSGDGKITVSWLAPSGYAGPAVDKYAVQQSLTGTSGWTTIGYPTTRSYTAGGLTNGTKYYFHTRAHNAAGWGPYSPVVNTVPGTVPTAPQNPTLQPGDRTIIVSWQAPSGYVGAAVEYYRVQQATNPAGPWKDIASPGCCSHPATGLTNGTRYYFRVRAHNTAGWGPYSPVVSAIPVGVPGAPRNLTATVANSKVTLKWTAPLNDGGKPIDHYDIHFAESANGPEKFAGTTQQNEYVFNGSLGKTYYFKVYAFNALGYGPASTVSAAVPATVPSAPTNCAAVQLGGNGSKTMRVTWGPPSSDGGKPILFYEVTLIRKNPLTLLQTTYVWNPAATTYDFTVASYGEYITRVEAYNAVGVGDLCPNYLSMWP